MFENFVVSFKVNNSSRHKPSWFSQSAETLSRATGSESRHWNKPAWFKVFRDLCIFLSFASRLSGAFNTCQVVLQTSAVYGSCFTQPLLWWQQANQHYKSKARIPEVSEELLWYSHMQQVQTNDPSSCFSVQSDVYSYTFLWIRASCFSDERKLNATFYLACIRRGYFDEDFSPTSRVVSTKHAISTCQKSGQSLTLVPSAC